MHNSNRFWIILALAASAAWAQTPQTATTATITAMVNAAVTNTTYRAYAICQLQAALWGNYNATVMVPAAPTPTSQVFGFSLVYGILNQYNLTQTPPATTASVVKTGTVFVPDRDAAFAKGMPFWIGNVSYNAAGTSAQYTVYTNPSLTVTGAFDDFESIIAAANNPAGPITSDQSVIYNQVPPSSQPQTFTGSLCSNCGPFDPGNQYYLSIMTGTFPLFCPVSNQVDMYAARLPTPTIRFLSAALQAFDNGFTTSAGSWIQIFGENLSTTTRSWAASDFSGNLAPTSLDNVRVMVGNKPAYVSYISPNQINAQLPDDATLGSAPVQVINLSGTSNTRTITKSALSPAMLTTPDFLYNGKQYVAALFADFKTFVLPENQIPGVASRPAKPGDVIIVFGVGCGATNPSTPAGTISAGPPLLLPVSATFGTTPAPAVGYLTQGSVGLCQFNITVPEVPDGDALLKVTVGTTNTAQLYTSIRH